MSAFHIARVSILKVWREKTLVLLMTGLALFFSAVAGLLFKEQTYPTQIPVAFADLDGSLLSASLVEALQGEGMYQVNLISEDELYEAVRKGVAEVGFVVPAGFQDFLLAAKEPLAVRVVSLSSSNTGAAIASVLEGQITSYLLTSAVRSEVAAVSESLGMESSVDPNAVALKVSEDFVQNPALQAELLAVTNAGITEGISATQYVIGFSLMFTMFTVIFSAGDVLTEKREGTWLRLVASPAPKWSISAGKSMGALAVGTLQTTVLILASKYLFRVDFGPNLLGLGVVLFAYLLAITGLGSALSTFVKTPAQLSAVSPIVIVATSMLGGCYWPLEILTPTMQKIAKLTPQAWTMQASSDIAARGASLVDVAPDLGVLLGFAALFFAIGAARTKFE